MWDRLLTDCRIATMEAAPGNPLGIIENGAIGIQDGRIVRVGTRTEMAGNRAEEVLPLGGAWVTPGLIDCHTHLIFGGTRADEHAMRRAGATYEEIARAGGGIASTVRATQAASDDQLLASAALRLDALMRGGVTTVEIKSGYALDFVPGEGDGFAKCVDASRNPLLGRGGDQLVDDLADIMRAAVLGLGRQRVKREQGRDEADRFALAQLASDLEQPKFAPGVEAISRLELDGRAPAAHQRVEATPALLQELFV